MKIHLRDNYWNTAENREKFHRSPHVISAMLAGLKSVCGFSAYEGFVTDDVTQVECIMCKRIDEQNFERGRDL